MPRGEQSEERQRQKAKEMARRRSQELHLQRQQLMRFAIANSHNRWFQQLIQRPDVHRMFQKWNREYEGFEEFMTQVLTGDIDD